MFKKVSISISIFICIIFFQNCGETGFESQFTNSSSEINDSEATQSNGSNRESSSPEDSQDSKPPAPIVKNPDPTTQTPEVNLKFSNLKASLNDDNQVIISWDQSLPGSGQVHFGLFKNNLNQKTDLEESDLRSHRKVIRQDLQINKKYYFRATSLVNNKLFNSNFVSINYEPVVNNEPTPTTTIAKGDIASYCDESKPLCGIMYGLAIAGEGYGHTAKYRNAATIRFQA